MAKAPNVGDRAPDFSLQDASGNTVTLSALHAEKNVVLYFYPKDNTPVCTKEACAFRDSYEDFVDAGAEVVGVSRDDGDSHQGFADKHRLPFVLLSDTDGSVHKKYGALGLGGLLPKRVTFVIDREGVVRHRFSSMLQGQKHVEEALTIIKAQA